MHPAGKHHPYKGALQQKLGGQQRRYYQRRLSGPEPVGHVPAAGGRAGRQGQGKPAGAWQNADGYFKQKLSGESYNAVFGSYAFTQTKTGHINDSAVWGPKHAFENLPSFLKDGSSVTYLRYRVVETAIEYRGGKQAVTVVGDNPANGTYQYSFGPGLFSRPTGQMEKTSRKRSITCTGRRICTTGLRQQSFLWPSSGQVTAATPMARGPKRGAPALNGR